VEEREKVVHGVLAGKRYASNIPVVRLSTSNIVSSDERDAWPL
jgi:hypothetical protein